MRKLFIILLCCTVTLLAGYAGYRGYRIWREHHMLALARESLAKADTRNALLSLTDVLRHNPSQIEACRLMATITEGARSPSAIIWRNRVLELDPNSLDDRLALVQTALVLNDIATATNALEAVPPAQRTTYAYHNLAGTVYVTVNRIADADAQYREASRLEPDNPIPKLNLAVVRLHGTNELDRAEARIALQRISSNPTNLVLCSKAIRELVFDAVRNSETNRALELSRELIQNTNSLFSDRVIQLEILRRMNSPDYESALASCKAMSQTNLPHIYELTVWQVSRGDSGDALAWLQTLPRDMQTNQTVELLAMECRMMLHQWPELEASLEKQHWGDLEFFRNACRAYALRNQELASASQAAWQLALQQANNRKAALVMLVRLASQWNWRSETEDLLWSIVNQFPEEKWAYPALNRALLAGGRTRSLMTLYAQQLKTSPTDPALRNNLAMTALLLDAQEMKPNEMARNLYEQIPTNAAYASTYAFSLYRQKKYAEALKIMETLTPQQLMDPSIAGYYGLILKASGNSAKATTYLDLSDKTFLLPEERKMFQQAKSGS